MENRDAVKNMSRGREGVRWDAVSGRWRRGGEPRRSPAMHVNVTPLHVTTEGAAQWVHMSEPTSQLAAFDRHTRAQDRQSARMMKFKSNICAGVSPAEVGGEQSGSSPFKNFIFALNY